MDIKEQIHGLTEEMLTNLGRLVLRLHRSLDLRQSIWTITVVMQRWVRVMRLLVLPDIWILYL